MSLVVEIYLFAKGRFEFLFISNFDFDSHVAFFVLLLLLLLSFFLFFLFLLFLWCLLLLLSLLLLLLRRAKRAGNLVIVSSRLGG